MITVGETGEAEVASFLGPAQLFVACLGTRLMYCKLSQAWE